MDDDQRERFVQTVSGHLLQGVKGEVLERAFRYWTNVDADTGKQIAAIVRAGQGDGAADGDDRGVIREPRAER